MKLRCLLLLLASLPVSSPAAEPRAARAAQLETFPPDAEERKEMTRVQLLLDRANFRPGKIDGLGGEFTQKAADRYVAAMNLPAGSWLDTSSIPDPYTYYTLTEDDVRWIGPTASTPPEQAELSRMPYANVWELVAEMFHCDQNFLKELNPHRETEELGAGSMFRVPNVVPFRMSEVEALEKQRRAEEKARKAALEAAKKSSASPGSEEAGTAASPTPTATPSPSPSPALPKHRLVLLREPRLIEVYNAEDKLVGCFPCTPGSKTIPVPEGTWKVTSNILMPYFRYDKSVLKSGVPSDTAYNIPPGPNNYVGIVWMGINRRSVGMHGTNNPDQIGRNESSGCIRMANWDAFLVSQWVEKGTPLEVR